MAGASAAPILARLGGRVALGILLSLFIGSAVARAGNHGVKPDPALQPAPASSTAGPSPDPAPQAASRPSNSSSSSSSGSRPPSQPLITTSSSAKPSPQATVIPRPTGSGITLAPTGAESSANSTAGAAIRVPLRETRTAHARTHVKDAARGLTVQPAQVAVPWRGRDPLDVRTAVSSLLAPPSRNGMLLLSGAVAFAVLALASASLLRLLARMNQHRGIG